MASSPSLKLSIPSPPVTDSAPPPPPPAVGPSDEALLGRFRDGNVEAGEELVRRYFSPLMRYLRRLTGNEAMAEELHQQAWLSVLEHAGRFDASAGGGFKAWLFRIATNKANDQWRSSAREKSAKVGMRLVTEGEQPAADHRMESREEEQKLQKAIDKLPENQRKVLLLRYYSNLRFIEIADVMGCPLNTALGRMHKAMLRLKELMAD